MKRADEERCRLAFDSYVKKVSMATEVVWESCEANDPPDYYVYLDNVKFAVEVTTLMETIQVGTIGLRQEAINQCLWQFVEGVERAAKSSGMLDGGYLVCFPQPIDGFGDLKDRIQRELLEYIRTTQGLAAAPEKTVYRKGRQRCAIQKLPDVSDKVILAGPDGAKGGFEVAEDVRRLVQERITVKIDKLADISYPRILLLYDRYCYAHRQIFTDCAPELSSLGAFHTICVVRGTEECILIHTEGTCGRL
jgi:hypothetical protein